MNGIPTTGLESADPSSEADHLQRLARAEEHLQRAKEVLRHRTTHETQQACFLIDQAREALGIEEAEATG